MNATAVQGLHGALGCARVVVLNKTVVKALRLMLDSEVSSVARLRTMKVSGALTFLSGMIFTFCTWPVVSKIWRKTSSVTRGSRPPTYRALLLGSGAARRGKGPPLEGDMIWSPDIGELTAVGIGFVLGGM